MIKFIIITNTKKAEHFKKKHSERRRMQFRNSRIDAVAQNNLANNEVCGPEMLNFFCFVGLINIFTGLNFVKCNTLLV